MALIAKYFEDINAYLNEHQDTRVADWFLMSSPFYTLALCLSYISVVKYFGPKLMENRKPFQLKNVLIAYNLFQVVLSTWIFLKFGMNGWLTGAYNWQCQPVDYSNEPGALAMASAAWWYFFSKFIDFMDTIFFVLRKKNDHISVLHVVHHGIMPMSVWFGMKMVPGGNGSFDAFLNTFVHIVMYTYYLLSAFGPKVQKYLWWKKYLTMLQLAQFVAVLIHTSQLFFIECDYPRGFAWAIIGHAALFFCLFKHFYNKSYVRKDSDKANKSSHGHAHNGVQHQKENGYARKANKSSHDHVHNGVQHQKENGYARKRFS